MIKLFQTFNSTLQRSALLFFGVMMIVFSLQVVLPTQSASAAGCGHYDVAATSSYVDNGLRWYYGAPRQVPYSAACHDINLVRSSIQPVNYWDNISCAYFRVHFLRTGQKNTPQFICNSPYGSAEVATWVKDGTLYRVEATQPVKFHIFD